VTDNICQVVITAPDPDWLATFVRGLVKDRLCAGSHNVAEIRSIYRWRGSIEDHNEAHVALHTRVALVPAIVERTNNLHPYEVPCVVALPIVATNPAYHQWIIDETRPVADDTEDASLANQEHS
jgi:periplasmic divalent cation tolerance protein